MAFYKQLLKRECNKSVKISILCLTNLVRISESCEAFPLLKFFVSFLIPHFIPFLMSVTLWKENLLLENRSLIILMLAWFTNLIWLLKLDFLSSQYLLMGLCMKINWSWRCHQKRNHLKFLQPSGHLLQFFLLLLIKFFLLKKNYHFLQFYQRNVVWQSSRISCYHIVF